MRFDRRIVGLAAANPAFAPHFHIPLQSGSNRILRRMRRPYTAARFLDLLRYIRDRLPDAALGTEVLVGFPGEMDDDFVATFDLVRNSPLTYLHIFPFSAREGTEACSMPEQVSPRRLHERCEILREFSVARNLAFRQRFVGQILPAISLAEQEEMGKSVALTANYIHARIGGPSVPPNRLIRIRIDEVDAQGTRATSV
ncbi:MAG: radical SAM protein [Acidobacteriota bacterium]|jgi:threonylcarbamoyladenosine tRNA methylthiotransferase MtaB